MNGPYIVYQSRDGTWRVKFSNPIARVLGKVASYIIQAPSEKTANELAGIIARDILTGNYQKTTQNSSHSVFSEQELTLF